MRSDITVSVSDLRSKVSENLKKHRERFLAALEVWKKSVLEALDEAVADAKAGKRYQTYFLLPRPEDHTKEYERADRMLAMCSTDSLEITDQDYRNLVEDQWDWSHSFIASTSHYLEPKGAPNGADEISEDERP